MSGRFRYFVILAEMRTGSNFLESNFNAVPGLHSFGEVFNPHFIGHANKTELLGQTIESREADPFALLAEIQNSEHPMPGFRFFHDHDPRILDHCLADERCAKIILTRNPLDTYVSREIVRQTGQWRLNDMKHARTASIRFNAEDFEVHLAERQAFQLRIQRALQLSGQTGFYLRYEDIPDVDVLNGLLSFLGIDAKVGKISTATKKQNPRSLQEKVTNFEEMERALSRVDFFTTDFAANFEPRRGPRIPDYVAAAVSPLLFMPIPCSAGSDVLSWLADVDGVADGDLVRGFTQKKLRHWKRQAKGHRSFSVVRHPVARLHDAFQRHILLDGPDQYTEIRQTLRKNYKLPIPGPDQPVNLTVAEYRTALIAFADFVKGNLDGQTSIRTDGAWASQCEHVIGMAQFILPDHIFREDQLQDGLDFILTEIGKPSVPMVESATGLKFDLSEVYDAKIEAAVRAAYQRDYMMFGFGPWRAA